MKGKGRDEYQSALYKHSIEKGHQIDFGGIKILDRTSSDRKLLLKEMLYINKLKPTLNRLKIPAFFTNFRQKQLSKLVKKFLTFHIGLHSLYFNLILKMLFEILILIFVFLVYFS